MAVDRNTFYGEILVIVYTAAITVFLVTNDRHTVTASTIVPIVSSGDTDGLFFSTSAGEVSLSSNAMKNGTSAQSTAAEMFQSGETDETTFSLEIFTEETTARQTIKLSSSSVVATTNGSDETSSVGASSETELSTIEATNVLETSSEMEATTTGVTTVLPTDASSPIITPYTTTFSITTIEATILPITTPFETTAASTTTPTTTFTTISVTTPFETTAASTTTPTTTSTTIPITTPFETTAASTTTPTTTSTTVSSTKPTTYVPTIKTTPELNPCLPNPCRNQGICTKVSPTSYSCSCIPGYSGQLCEVEINECESFPCYGFGKCIDLVNDYECTCYPGYTRNSSNSRQCIAIDFCSQSNYTCFNNGTCVNQPQYSRYYCQCPPSIDNSTHYTGLDCGDITTTSPLPTNISTKSGILAGGTRVTVTGRGLLTLVPFGAHFLSTESQQLSELTGNVDQNSLSNTSIVIISPRGTAVYVNHRLQVVLIYNGPLNVTVPEGTFTYQGDPVIDDIRPRDILAAGGVNITVTGSNMNVVTNPLLDITTIVFNATTKDSTRQNYTESCSSRIDTEMTCRIPVGIVPDTFLLNRSAVPSKSGLELYRHLSPNWHRSRRQKRDPIASLKDSETGSTFEMYLGFVLDDLPTYENTSKSLPNIVLKLVTTLPTIDAQLGKAEDFNPKTQTVAHIKGSNLTLGCLIADYTIMVGNETCSVTNLTNNEITYMPPKEKPATPDCDTPEGTFTVTVKVSTVTQKAYCLRYVNGPEIDEALIIGASVAGGVILLLVIVCLCLMVKRRRRKSRKKKNQESDDSSIASSRERNDYEDSCSQKSTEPDYLETLPDAAESGLEGPGADVSSATFHRPASSSSSSYYYYNASNDGLVPREDHPVKRTWHYEPNDEALTFDLKRVKFERVTSKLPRPSFSVDPRQSTTSLPP